MECACCEEKFLRKAKGFKRVSLGGRFKGGPSVADSLTKNFPVSFTPGKNVFICEVCTRTIRSFDVKREQLNEAEEKFRKVRKPGSYIAMKLATPTHGDHNRAAKRPRVLSSPLCKPSRPSQVSSKEKIALAVNNTEIGRALQQLSMYQYGPGFRLLFKCSQAARKAAVSVLCNTVRKEIVDFCKIMNQKDTGLKAMIDFNWQNIIDDSKMKCPSILEFLTAMVTRKHRQRTATKKSGKKIVSLLPAIGSMLSVIHQIRSRRSGLLQLMVSLLLWIGGCKRKVFGSLNKLGWCQGIEATRKRIDSIKAEFDTKVLTWKDDLLQKEREHDTLNDTLDDLVDLDDVWDDIDEGGDVDEAGESGNEAGDIESEHSEPSEETLESPEETPNTATSASQSSTSIYANSNPRSIGYYDITFDNINQKIGVRHHIRGKKCNMLNMVNAYATLERIGSYGLSNNIPNSERCAMIGVEDLMPTVDDVSLLKEELVVLVCRILSRYVPAFKDVDTIWSIPHQYSEQSARRSEIVPLGVINKDESTTGGMIDIMEAYSKYVPIDSHGQPEQLILFCDGLSCERMEGAQRARVNGVDALARLEMFEPGIQEWHRRLMFVQDSYDELFKIDSQREKGTLYNLKQVYDHKNVSKNVMENFDKAEELLVFATEGYVLLSALEKLQFESLKEDPFNQADDRKQIRDDIANQIVEEVFEMPNIQEVVRVSVDTDVDESEYCICKLSTGGNMVYCGNRQCKRGSWFHFECLGLDEDEVVEENWYCSDDCKIEAARIRAKHKTVDKFRDIRNEYSKHLVWRGLNDIARHDAVKENDGLRMIRHWKFDLFQYYENNHPKYLIFGERLLANVAGAASARIKHQLIWERTVNVKGGQMRNIPKDLHCEHLNMEYKLNSRSSIGQLTEKTVARHSQMLGLGKILNDVFQEQVVSRQYTRKHGKVDRTADVERMVKSLHPLRIFRHKAGRGLKGFEDFKIIKGVRQPKKFKQRLIKHLDNLVKIRALNEI